MLMMRPLPCRLRCGRASRDMRAKNSSERWTAIAHCSSVASWARARGGPPELLTMMSRRPKRPTVAAISSRANLLCRRLEVALGTAAHGHPDAFPRQHFGTRPPQAFAGSPDDRHLVLELEVHGTTLSATLGEHSRGRRTCARSKGSRSSTATT